MASDWARAISGFFVPCLLECLVCSLPPTASKVLTLRAQNELASKYCLVMFKNTMLDLWFTV